MWRCPALSEAKKGYDGVSSARAPSTQAVATRAVATAAAAVDTIVVFSDGFGGATGQARECEREKCGRLCRLCRLQQERKTKT